MANAKRALSVVRAVAKMDGWKNILTGLGIKGRDRRATSKIEWELMDETSADELYSASDIARKIVDEVVKDAFREGYELKSDDTSDDFAKRVEDEEQRLQVDAKLQEAWILARMYGGSGIIPMPRDIDLLAKPFVPESLASIRSLLVLSRWELQRESIETDVRSPNFARPRMYRITPRTGADQMNVSVHHSWILRFDGSYLPRIKYFKNNLWHDSILNTCKTAIRDYDSALSAVSATLDDFSVGVFKMKDLARALSEDKDDLIQKRLEITNISRSVAKMIIIDSESEDFQYQDRQMAGVADAVKLIAGRLVVASNMPHTKILGESPQGSNATGNSTTKDWYDHVGAEQENYLDPRLIKLWRWIFAAKKGPTGGKVPTALKALYAPLWQEPQSTQADIRYKTAQADASDIEHGVLDPAEVAVSRYGTGKYSVETQLADQRESQIRKVDPKPMIAGAQKDPEEDPTPAKPPVKAAPVVAKKKDSAPKKKKRT